MATEGTKLVIQMRDNDTGDKKTVNVTNPNDAVTSTQIEEFTTRYGSVYDVSMSLSTAYFEEVTHRAIGT